MLSTLPIGHGPGTGMTSPRKARWAWASAAELSNPARLGDSGDPQRALALAGITPPFAVIASTLSAAPSATIGTPLQPAVGEHEVGVEHVGEDVQRDVQPDGCRPAISVMPTWIAAASSTAQTARGADVGQAR